MASTDSNAEGALFAVTLQGYTFHSSFIFEDFCNALRPSDDRDRFSDRRRFRLDDYDVVAVKHESGPELFFLGAASVLVVEKLVKLLGDLLRSYIAAIARQNQRYPTDHDAENIEVLLKTRDATIPVTSIRKISSSEYILNLGESAETLTLAVESLVRHVSAAGGSEGAESYGPLPLFAKSDPDLPNAISSTESSRPPRVFISYSWDSDGHKNWVAKLATRLRSDGINIILDQWEVRLGDQLPQFMERAVRESDFVCIVCSPRYKERSNSRRGGVGYEGQIITAEVFHSQNERKFIPVLRSGSWDECAPSWLLGKYYCDLTGEPYQESAYRTLTNTVHGLVELAPPLGLKPAGKRDILVAFQSFVETLPVVSENIFAVITNLETTYAIGGYAESRPTVPDLMDQEFHKLEELCKREKVQLSNTWRDRYWAAGRINATTQKIKDRSLRFLRSADIEMLKVAKKVEKQHSDTRFGLAQLLAFGDIRRQSADVEGFEALLRRMVDIGLITEGRPTRSPSSADYLRTMRHGNTALVGQVSRFLDLAESEGIRLEK
jgi:hypothetical protein